LVGHGKSGSRHLGQVIHRLLRTVTSARVGRLARHGTVARIGRLARLAGPALLVLAIALVAACADRPTGYEPGSEPAPGLSPVTPVTQQGQYLADFYPVVFAIALGVFLLVEGLLVWIVLRYRRKPTDTELPAQTHGHNMLEILWTLIPALIVTGLFVFTVDALGKIETANNPNDNPALVIDVTGFQWQWTFDYPAQGLSFTGTGRDGPVMALPINEKVRIRLHSADVIHSFYVPQFLYKKDVVPGRTNEFDVVVNDVGTYSGQCAEFCGLGHADMHFTVQSMTQADFDAWVAQNQQATQTQAPPPAGSQTITINAVNFTTFDPPNLTAVANEPIVFDFHNVDTAQPHNIAIVGANPDGSDWAGQPIAQPGQTAQYTAPALKPGTYTFYCQVHPTTMRGTLTVQ
jgi:cytochrome c oxidase subunit 2